MKSTMCAALIPNPALHLPLYKIDGGSFTSGDARGLLITGYGPVWTPSGRKFDGIDDYLDCGNPQSVQLSSSFTIIAWINTSNSATQAIISKYDANGNQRGYMLHLVGAKSKLTVSSSPNPFTGAERSGNATLSLNTWNHIAAVYIPSANQDLYLNGQLDNGSLSGTIPGGVANPARNLAIGADYSNSVTPNNYWFNGTIGEILVCGRALTPLEIQHHYLLTEWRYR